MGSTLQSVFIDLAMLANGRLEDGAVNISDLWGLCVTLE